MLASELIKELQKAIAEHGDLPVITYGEDYDERVVVTVVRFFSDSVFHRNHPPMLEIC